MEVNKSYRIWFSPRNGSTLLCKGLEQTGIAGKPLELFNLVGEETLRSKYQINSYESLKEELWKLGSTSNGIFGIKHSLFSACRKKVSNEIKDLRGNLENDQGDNFWDDLFPQCKHIFMTRRNKIRQAVSWWKAIKDSVWHLEASEAQTSEKVFFAENYDFDAIHHLFREASLRECAIQAYFSANNIIPLTIVYEDYIKRYDNTIKEILDYLEVDQSALNIQPKYYKKIANEGSEIWVQRFRKELQEKMGVEAW